MKVHNVIIVFDVYAVAEEPAAAREAIIAAINNGEIKISDQNAIPVNHERSIRDSWRDERPFIGADVSDEDFESLKGKTTLEIFKMIMTKEPPADPTAKAPKAPKK